jgi:hypothetical protein
VGSRLIPPQTVVYNKLCRIITQNRAENRILCLWTRIVANNVVVRSKSNATYRFPQYFFLFIIIITFSIIKVIANIPKPTSNGINNVFKLKGDEFLLSKKFAIRPNEKKLKANEVGTIIPRILSLFMYL